LTCRSWWSAPGTRNHFALDLGLDRDDPSTCLGALTDGEELQVDLGLIADRTFVNNASFGAYAEVVRSPACRDDKRGTTLQTLPDLLSGHRGALLTARAAGTRIEGPQALLLSNDPYEMTDIAGLGRRARLDTGTLGVVAAAAARLLPPPAGGHLRLRKAGVIVRELVEVRPGDLRRRDGGVIAAPRADLGRSCLPGAWARA